MKTFGSFARIEGWSRLSDSCHDEEEEEEDEEKIQ
jgi:hypothetical protein